jgi:tetratricopeptide (TPR) repeat protein
VQDRSAAQLFIVQDRNSHWHEDSGSGAQSEPGKTQAGRRLNCAVQIAWPNREDSRQGLLDAYFQLGRTFGYKHELAQAETWFRKTCDLAADWLVREPGNLRFAVTLAASHRKLADMKKLAGDLEAARRDYLQAIAVGRDMMRDQPSHFENKSQLATAIDDLAGVALRQGQVGEARSLYEESQRIFVELETLDPEDQMIQIHLIMGGAALARIERGQGRLESALALFRRSQERLMQLEDEGQLVGRPALAVQLTTTLRQDIADCEAAPIALGDLEAIKARPLPESAAFLLARTRLLCAEGRTDEALEAASAISGLEVRTAADFWPFAGCMAGCAVSLQDQRWPSPPAPERTVLKRLCTDRAIDAFDWAQWLGQPVGESARDR